MFAGYVGRDPENPIRPDEVFTITPDPWFSICWFHISYTSNSRTLIDIVCQNPQWIVRAAVWQEIDPIKCTIEFAVGRDRFLHQGLNICFTDTSDRSFFSPLFVRWLRSEMEVVVRPKFLPIPFYLKCSECQCLISSDSYNNLSDS